jgi:hypothetical protein
MSSVSHRGRRAHRDVLLIVVRRCMAVTLPTSTSSFMLHASYFHSVIPCPVLAPVAWNLRGLALNDRSGIRREVCNSWPHGDCTAPSAPCNDVGGVSLRPLRALCAINGTSHRQTFIGCHDINDVSASSACPVRDKEHTSVLVGITQPPTTDVMRGCATAIIALIA